MDTKETRICFAFNEIVCNIDEGRIVGLASEVRGSEYVRVNPSHPLGQIASWELVCLKTTNLSAWSISTIASIFGTTMVQVKG